MEQRLSMLLSVYAKTQTAGEERGHVHATGWDTFSLVCVLHTVSHSAYGASCGVPSHTCTNTPEHTPLY